MTTAEVLYFPGPENLRPRGTFVMVPGRGEEPGVYARLGRRLAFDAYRTHVVENPIADPDRTRGQILDIVGQDDGSPFVLAGSDSGALFCVASLLSGEVDDVDALVLAGLPAAGATPVASSWEQELDARTTCPTHRALIADSLVTPGAIYEPLPGDWLEQGSLDAIRQPILGLHGRDDEISPLGQARDAYAAAGDVQLITVAGARHDVLNDRNHRTVTASLVIWLELLQLEDRSQPIVYPEPTKADLV